MPLAREALARVLLVAEMSVDQVADVPPFRIFGADGSPITGAERTALIEASRAGKHVEIEIEGTTYLQAGKPGERINRNGIRFKQGALRAIAKSGKNTPFLRNHAQRSQADRGGTIVESKVEKLEDGISVIVQRARLTTPWAVQGALEGTIDRFSIGWHPTGPVVYAHSGEEIEGWPKHWPLDVLEDGTVVEWEFTAAELVETSSVNVPAVVGTGIEQIRSALTAAAGDSNQPRERQSNKETEMPFPKDLKAKLGLAETATDEEVLARIDENAKAAASVGAAQEQLAVARAKNAETEERLRLETERVNGERIETRIRELRSRGALPVTASKTEEWLRSVAKSGGVEAFEKCASDLPAGMFHPAGAPNQSEQPAPAQLAAGVIPMDEGRKSRMKALGLTEKSYDHAPGRFELGTIPAKKGA